MSNLISRLCQQIQIVTFPNKKTDPDCDLFKCRIRFAILIITILDTEKIIYANFPMIIPIHVQK